MANRPELLKRAMLSVLEGQKQPGELLIIVDLPKSQAGPDSDAAKSVFQKYAGTETEFRLLISGGIGPAGARNRGVLAAEGDWIAFLDSDDVWLPEKLDRQLDYLQKRPQLVGCQTGELWYRQNTLLKQPRRLHPPVGRFLQESFKNCLISSSSIMFRRDIFQELEGFDESFLVCEDFEFWLRFQYHWPMGLLPRPLIAKYSGDWPQQSKRFHSMDRERIRAILKFTREHRLDQKLKTAARQACLDKLQILKLGAEKRGKIEELTPLEAEIRAVFQR